MSDESIDFPETLANRLRPFGQEHLLNRSGELDSAARQMLEVLSEVVFLKG